MSNKPHTTLRIPGGLKATIWINSTSEGKTYASADVIRSYKKDEQWKETTSYTQDDLLKLSKIAQLAYDAINDIKQGGAK